MYKHNVEKLWLATLVTATIAVRIGLSLIACDNIDVQNYARVAAIVRERGIFALYTQTAGIYPYPPLWVWFEILAQVLSETSRVNFGLLIRCPIILADAGIVYLIWKWCRETATPSILLGASYALNPISLMITCLHGQFDAIPAFFSLLAIYKLEHSNYPFSAAALALGIAFKSYPVLFLPLCLHRLNSFRNKVGFVAIAILPVILIVLPYSLYAPTAVLREWLSYKGAALLGMLVPVRAVYVPLTHEHFPVPLTLKIIGISRWLFLAGYVGFIARQISRFQFSLVTSCTVVLMLFYFLYAGIAPQYLVWVLPFLLVMRAGSLLPAWLYSLTGAMALYGFYAYAVPETLCFLPQISSGISRVIYGFSGSLWWIVSAVLLIWFTKNNWTKG